MNTSVQAFSFNNTNVRTVIVDNEPWFVVMDICTVLGIGNPTMAARNLDEDSLNSTEVIDSIGRRKKVIIANESGVYELVFQSRKPEAKAFMRWVTKEVLPAIRKTGSYGVAPAVDLAAITRKDLALMIVAEADRADVAEQQLAIAAPKVKVYETFIEDGQDFDCRDAAQMLQNDHGIKMGQNRLFDWLQDNGWTDRNDRPIQRKLDQGLLSLKFRNYVITHSDGSKSQALPQVRITPKGLAKILAIMTQDESVKAIEPKRIRRTLNPERV